MDRVLGFLFLIKQDYTIAMKFENLFVGTLLGVGIYALVCTGRDLSNHRYGYKQINPPEVWELDVKDPFVNKKITILDKKNKYILFKDDAGAEHSMPWYLFESTYRKSINE